MNIKILSWNVNGIRAVEKKGDLQELLRKTSPDIAFFQETKATAEQLSEYLTQNQEYDQYYHSAEKKGYSGTGLWIKKSLGWAPHTVETGMEGWVDTEGRVLSLTHKKYIFYGIYFPNGGKSPEAWEGKLDFYRHFLELINRQREAGYKIIFTGDLNVAHREIDLARPKENEKNIGFLPEERAWVDDLIKDDWVDVYRRSYPESVSYTWWNLQTRSRERNIGWRIDYAFCDKSFMFNINSIEYLNDVYGSDHCPLLLEIVLRFED